MFRPPVPPIDVDQVSRERAQRSEKVEGRMVELLESSRKSVDDTRSIRRVVQDVRHRIDHDPFLIVGGDN